MNESTWTTCRDPAAMLQWLQDSGKMSERKARLFAVACCRHIWDDIASADARWAVEVAERQADGLATQAEVDEARRRVEPHIRYCVDLEGFVAAATSATLWADAFEAARWSAMVVAEVDVSCLAYSDAEARFADLLRDFAGSPFSPAAVVDPLWRTPDVVTLAGHIYHDRAFDRMPELADALESAGCADPEILGHCRQQGTVHVRGCWLIDLLLNKT